MIDAQEHGLARVMARLEATVRALEPERMAGEDAARLLEVVIRTKRVCSAAEAALAARVDETNAWRSEGHRSAAHWLAAKEGASVGAAIDTLSTGRSLAECPRTAQAFRAGELSEAQAREITQAAVADPTAETRLLDTAATASLHGLREQCRAVRASAEPDQYERIHRGRYLRCWTDPDGAGRGAWRLTPDAHARVSAALDAHLEQTFTDARREGRRESREAYAADALVALADGIPATAKGVKVVIHRNLSDHGDHTHPAERCEIPGVGPIPTAAARSLISDAIITAVVQDGHDVTRVAHLGRTIPANLRRALELRDPVCAVPGCDQRHGLEIDHRIPFALGGPASLDNLVRLCRWHHRQKHIEGYRLTGGPGHWCWQPPQPVDDLAHAPP